VPERDESAMREDLRATADSVRDDARRVGQIEEEKQKLDPGDPRLTTLSNEAERVAADMQRKSRMERHLAGEATDGDDSAGQGE